MLPNGNIVVIDSSYVPAGSAVLANVGAVHLYDGASLALISTLTGSQSEDRVGSGGFTVLANGNFVVSSPHWSNRFGAVTLINAVSGLAGFVGPNNSRVGSTFDDHIGARIGRDGVTLESTVVALPDGAFVFTSQAWDRGALVNAGAVSWSDGVNTLSNTISPTTDFVGARARDRVGFGGIVLLANGHYVVASPEFDDGLAVDAGAITWADGRAPLTGSIDVSNSLIGSHANDRVGAVNIRYF